MAEPACEVDPVGRLGPLAGCTTQAGNCERSKEFSRSAPAGHRCQQDAQGCPDQSYSCPTLNNDEDSYIAIVFGYDDDRSQLITVRNFQDEEEEWVEFRTFVCAEADLNARVALRK